MAEIAWTEPAINDLDTIADYISLDDPVAAAELVRRVFSHAEQLAKHPESGSIPPELKKSRYRQLVEPPCRIFYRYDGNKVYILYVLRSRRKLKRENLSKREPGRKHG